MDDNICFVCFDHGGYKRCNCNTFVHDQCLARLLQSVPSHSGKCAVCCSEYYNVHTTTKNSCKVSRDACILFCVAYAGMFLLISGSSILILHGYVIYGMLFSISIPFAGIVLWFLHNIHYSESEGSYCPYIIVTQKSFVINSMSSI